MTDAAATPDVVDVLTADHHRALALLDSIKASSDAEVRRSLADVMISELVGHSVAEEMFVYPAMRRHLPNGDAAVKHDLEEHQELEQVMKRLENTPAGGADFDVQLGALERVLRDHVDDEERHQFPHLRSQIPRAELVEMAEKVHLAKQVGPTRPHPSTPNSQLFHLLVGPGVGLVDRVRDVLTKRSTP